jgi:hypothetical protein
MAGMTTADRTCSELRYLLERAGLEIDRLPAGKVREGVLDTLRIADDWLRLRQEKGGRRAAESPLGLPINAAVRIAEGLVELGGASDGAG